MKKHAFLLLISLYLVNLVNAQHDDHHDTHQDEHHDEHHDEHSNDHSSDHHAHKHHIAIFGGAATNFSHHLTKPGIGIDYEYRISNPVGIGFVAEVEFTEKESFLYSIPVFYHPFHGLKIYAGPAMLSTVEHHEDESGHGDTHVEEPKREIHYGGRIGIAYDFYLGKISIGPTVNYAFANSTALIYGINVGIGF